MDPPPPRPHRVRSLRHSMTKEDGKCGIFWSLALDVTFIFCLVVTIVLAVYSFMTLHDSETGTKMELWPAGKVQVPPLAVCRHPQNIIGPKSDSWDLEEDFGLTITDIESLGFYQAIEAAGQSFDAILGSHLLSGWEGLVKRAEVFGGSVAYDEEDEKPQKDSRSFVSTPEDDPESWEEFYHPLRGNCITFKPDQSRLAAMGGVRSILLALVTEEGVVVPPEEDKDDNALATQGFRGQNPKNQKHMIEKHRTLYSYQDGSFLRARTGVKVRARPGKCHYFVHQQEIVDKTETKKVAGCNETSVEGERIKNIGDKEDDFLTTTSHEDDCIYMKLVEQFVKEFNCLHARLKELPIKFWNKYSNIPTCKLKDVKPSVNSMGKTEDAGLTLIRSLLSDFAYDTSLKDTCRPPCRRAYFGSSQLETYVGEQEALTTSEKEAGEETLVLVQYHPYVKVYEYHYLYNWYTCLADIGGYSGLFLGLSLFSVVTFLAKSRVLRSYFGKGAQQRRGEERQRQEEQAAEQEKERLQQKNNELNA